VADRAATLAKAGPLNLCGRFPLRDFAEFVQGLDVLVTPDTGPMHLSSWLGVRTLNLSMGPVNPWETGPYQPGHVVLQAAMSCTGCWRCTHPVPHACRSRFRADRVAFLVHRLAKGGDEALLGLRLHGLRLLLSGRNGDGLYHLADLDMERRETARQALSLFWKEFFGAAFGLWEMERAERAWEHAAAGHAALARTLREAVAGLAQKLAAAVRSGGDQGLDEHFWRTAPPLLRPLSGYLLPLLQNSDFSATGFRQALSMLERVVQVTASTR
jgi:hypothetical protein